MQTPEIECVTCGKSGPKGWEAEWHPFQHPVNGKLNFGPKTSDGVGGSATPAPDVGVAQAAAWPFDPVLRQALVDKGILTIGDLVEAERKIRMVTGVMTGVLAGTGGGPETEFGDQREQQV